MTEIASLIEQLRQKNIALGDAPGNSREAAAAEYHQTKAAIARAISGLSDAGLDRPLAQLAELERIHAIALAANASLTQLAADAPDYRLLRGRERDAEWSRQQGITASRRALQHGVEYFNGLPAVPKLLSDLLGGERVESDGRVVRTWYGSLPSLDARLTELRARVATLRAMLAAHVTAAEWLLADEATRARFAAERAAERDARPSKLRGYSPDGSLSPV